MSKIFVILTILLLLYSNAIGGYGYDNPYNTDSVIAPVHIENEGLYNLVISIQFLKEPYEKKPYESDKYRNFIRRMSVEWSTVALNKVLNSKVKSLEDLPVLKSNIEAEISKLADSLKSKYSLDEKVEVVFSLSNFYLVFSKRK